MSEHDGTGEIAEARPRTFKPNERVIVRWRSPGLGTILGSHIADGEYTVFIEGAGAFRLPASDLEPAPAEAADPPTLFTADADVAKRLRQITSQLRDWQARVPTIIRECEALERLIGG